MIEHVGRLTGKSIPATGLVGKIKNQFQQLLRFKTSIKTCYLIWQNPFITVGGDTFISDMLAKCGLQNITGEQLRYPEISIKQLIETDCRLLLLSSEPFPFKQKHVAEIRKLLKENGIGDSASIAIELVDGEMFSWYGSRLLLAPNYFNQLQTRLLYTG
jgi:ABC-type Fe3+-hydroxamate transport system substrate-binding protein